MKRRPRWATGRGLAFLILVGDLRGVPTLPTIPTTPFDVVAFGAVGDGRTDNTLAIQSALQAAAAAQGGIVRFPAAAAPYLCGPLTIGGGILLQIDAGAVLQMLPYGAGRNTPGTYPLERGAYANFLSFQGNHVGLAGGGVIDGGGPAWWAAFDADSSLPHRPHLVQFTDCRFVLVRGITLRNSPMFHVAFAATHHVTIDGVTLTAPPDTPNTDGLDPAGTAYLIQNCTISTGDDNICLKPQHTPCADITIRQCTFGTGHGLSIGGQTNAGVDGLTVTDCTFEGTTYGLRLKADPTAGGLVQNLVYANLTMRNVQYPIAFYSYYDLVGSPGATTGSNQTTVTKVAAWNATAPSAAYRAYATATLPAWRNITINNLTATRAASAPDGHCLLWGLPNRPITGVVLNNVRTTGYAGFAFFNAADIQLRGTTSLAGTVLAYNAQVVRTQPQSQATYPGGPAVFATALLPANASLGPIVSAWQWSCNGQPLSDGPTTDGAMISGAKTERLTVQNVASAHTGLYTASVTSRLDTHEGGPVPGGLSALATTAAATLAVGSSANVGRLTNVSVRSSAGPGAGSLIAGFTLGGNGGGTVRLLVRGMGPSLAALGVTGFLRDPRLTLFRASTVIATNDDWEGAAPLKAALAQSGAFAFASDASQDSALISSLGSGGHTMQITGSDGSSGTAIAEAYDLTPPESYSASTSLRITNLSARAPIEAGGILFAGFNLGGSTARTVLIRAVGPSLDAFGVPGTLSDPRLELFTGAGTTLQANDDWGGNSALATTAAAVGAFPLAANSKDSALVITLSPGSYTTQVSGVGGASGVALVEIYELP